MNLAEQIKSIYENPFRIYPRLSPLQQRAATLASRGYTIFEIADELTCSDSAAASLIHVVKKKLKMSKFDLVLVPWKQIERLLENES